MVRTPPAREVLRSIRELADPTRLEGMARYGIDTRSAVGVTVTELRALARGLGRDHALAGELWASGIHEARILASIVDDPDAVTERQMESWVREFDSWDLCDQVCLNLFDRTPFTFDKAIEWSAREPEFEKRAGFALMAMAAVHRRDRPDHDFHVFLPRIRAEATDERNYVRKAVSWALRQIGKRSAGLHARAIRTARQIESIDARSARWIARDVLRELESPAVRERLARR
ncbi:MAG TPA: DNA alkylation repair protein [Actinomycetota bacterium]|nr:DNA alkylation repair protein [Actinomycetota bacterium]